MHLPDLVLAEVAQNLDYKSLCDLMQVNRRLYELVLGNRRLWNRFKLHIEPCDHFTMPSAKRRFESVEIRGFYLYDEFHLTFALDVKQLWMIDCFSAQDKYDEFLQKMPNMEQVLVVGHHFTLVNNPRELPYE